MTSLFYFGYTTAIVSQGCHDEVPQTGSLKQQNFISLWFWKLEVQELGVGNVDFF